MDLEPVDHDPFSVQTVPVDHDPFAPVAKAGQTIQSPDILGQQRGLQQSVTSGLSSALGLTDAARALRGEMTPEEAQMFALGAIPMLAGGPEAKVAEEAVPAVARGIRAFHGSPYDFNAFDLSKIGTGEGAQAYGHGLYFAENPATAKEYRASLANRQLFVDGKKVGEIGALGNDPVANAAHLIVKNNGDVGAAKAETYASIARSAQGDYGFGKSLGQKVLDQIDTLAAKTVEAREGGKMYEVNINADPEHFLDWDKPLSEDHPARQRLKELAQMGLDTHEYGVDRNLAKDAFLASQNPNLTGEGVVRKMSSAIEAARPALKEQGNPRALFGDLSSMTSEELRNVGVPGIKYLDQGSRTSGDGTRNYVVFNDKLIDILKKYGLAGLVAGGAAHFSTHPIDHDPFAQ